MRRFEEALKEVPSLNLVTELPLVFGDEAVVTIAAAAIDIFVKDVIEVQPWTGLGDLLPHELDSLRRRALSEVTRGL